MRLSTRSTSPASTSAASSPCRRSPGIIVLLAAARRRALAPVSPADSPSSEAAVPGPAGPARPPPLFSLSLPAPPAPSLSHAASIQGGGAPPQAPAAQRAVARGARRIGRELAALYPDAHTELNFPSSLELLVATILSAQTTDRMVNQVTPVLFARYRTAADYASADRAEMEEITQSTGFFRAKTSSLIGLGQPLGDPIGGAGPRRLRAAGTLP